MTNTNGNTQPIPDCDAWYGIPFIDLDCRHWLPYLTAEEIGQDTPKFILGQEFPTDWTLPANTEGPRGVAA